MTHPGPSHEHDHDRDVRHAYDQVAEDYAAHFPGTEPEQPIELAFLDHFLSLLPDDPDILDAGSGTGRMSRLLSDRGCRVRAVDVSPGMVTVARRNHPDIPAEVASITAIPFPNSTFDGILAWYSTIHLADADLPQAIREITRVLKPGGLTLIAFQAGQGSREVGEGYRRLGHDVTLVRHHRTADDVAHLLEEHGLTQTARLVRAPAPGFEREDQAFLIAGRA
ncbi:class I SAM-dependent DNA methyltransferase [Mariniluteicoccus flavus]